MYLRLGTCAVLLSNSFSISESASCSGWSWNRRGRIGGLSISSSEGDQPELLSVSIDAAEWVCGRCGTTESFCLLTSLDDGVSTDAGECVDALFSIAADERAGRFSIDAVAGAGASSVVVGKGARMGAFSIDARSRKGMFRVIADKESARVFWFSLVATLTQTRLAIAVENADGRWRTLKANSADDDVVVDVLSSGGSRGWVAVEEKW